MKRILVCAAVAVITSWISADVFAAADANKPLMREKQMEGREARMESMEKQTQKMHDERMAELKHIRNLAVEEKAVKTTEALDKLIAKEQSQFEKRTEMMKEREAKMKERMKQMKEKQPPVQPTK